MNNPLFHRAIRELASDHDIESTVKLTLDDLLALLPELEPRRPLGFPGCWQVASQRPPLELPNIDTDTFFPSPPTIRSSLHSNPFRSMPGESTRKTLPPPLNQTRLGRFKNLGLIGRGGMGEVYRVRDPDLNRRMVLKVLRRDHLGDESAIARFLEEARLTSQLDHPGIVPVHEMGTLDDGRLFFTMREVRGRTLTEVINETHRNFDATDADEQTWSAHFRGLIDIFFRVCEPIAYAHSQNIIHRDLKPSNIMVGDFGEVQLLDWGLAKIVGTSETPPPNHPIELGNRRAGTDTHPGAIVGTPAFMPPEQAYGDLKTLGPASDVYALGAILFMVLDGQMPFEGPTTASILFKVIEGIDRLPGRNMGVPPALTDICLRAMSIDACDRHSDAAAVAEAIAHWRDGSSRLKRAFELIETADDLIPRIDDLRTQAHQLRRQSHEMLKKIPRTAPIEQKRPAWILEEEADLLEREAGAHRARAIHKLDAALASVPDFDEAHDRLATIYRRDHAEAEHQRNLTKATSLEVFLRAHNTGTFDDYLEGTGTLTLRTSPPGARVTLFRYVRNDRRLVTGLERHLDHTPIENMELPMGSYLLEINASRRATVRYPVYIGRLQNWTGSPGATELPFRIQLPFSDELADDDIYVPGSSFWRGGDDRASNGAFRSITWVAPFIIKKHPVTHGQYLDFLNDLVARGHIDDAQRYCPKNVGNIGYGHGTSIYVRDDNGCYRPRSSDPDFVRLPVSLIDLYSAHAYARWYGRQTGTSWRLPTSNEWEKAARGVAGRFFPWGDFLDPTWCRMLHSSAQMPQAVPIDDYPDDISPYGMRGAAGNIRDWCVPDDIDNFDDITDDTPIPFRGGCWFSTPEVCRLATREYKSPMARSAGTGFRLARDY